MLVRFFFFMGHREWAKHSQQVSHLRNQKEVSNQTQGCTTDYIRKPLLKLAHSDIGDEARETEANLSQALRCAKDWGAVLLVDEADIYLEKRGGSDLRRNTLVSGTMLRHLD